MVEKVNLFGGNPTIFEKVPLEEPLSEACRPCCEYYGLVYSNASRRALDNNDNDAAITYRFLSILMYFAPSFDTPEEPYQARFVLCDKRGYVPADLSNQDIVALEKLAPLTKDSSLRSRLYDLLWVLKKDHKACAEAAAQYIEAADRLNNKEDWMSAECYYKRGLQLAGFLGRTKPLYINITKRFVEAVRIASNDPNARAVKFIRLLIEFKCGDPNEFVQCVEEIAIQWEKKQQFYKARIHWEVAIDLYRWAKNMNDERRCRLAAAETYISEAHQRGVESKGTAAHFLQMGIEALRQTGEEPERIRQLKAELAEYQEASLDELQSFSTEIDISEFVKTAERHVAGKNLSDALFSFALGHRIMHPDEMKDEVKEQAGRTPLQFLMSINYIDEHGRTYATHNGLSLDDDETQANALEHHAFNRAQFHWRFRAVGYIEPARRQIFNDHHPTYNDLLFIVRNNPFIQRDHENIFLRGIHAGFHGDFLLASNLLVPQIENSLRYILEAAGIDITNLYSDGTQPVKTLGALFSIPDLEKILGADMCFELRGHLIEKSGYDFRNRLCHGFVTDNEFYNSVAPVSIWWLVLRLCMIPLYYKKSADERTMVKRKRKTKSKASNPIKVKSKTN